MCVCLCVHYVLVHPSHRHKQKYTHRIFVMVTACSTLLWQINWTTQGFNNIGANVHAL